MNCAHANVRCRLTALWSDTRQQVFSLLMLAAFTLPGIDVAVADGYHDALLDMKGISPEMWAKNQKDKVAGLKADATKKGAMTQKRGGSTTGALSAGTGFAIDKPKADKPWWKKGSSKMQADRGKPKVAIADSPEMRSMADKLMEYLQLMTPENILQHEFPDFPKDKIPEYRRRAKEILTDMGLGIVKQIIQRLANAKKGSGQAPMFGDCRTAAEYESDLRAVLECIIDEACKSPGGFAAVTEILRELITDPDAEVQKTARLCFTLDGILNAACKSPDGFLAVVEMLLDLAENTDPEVRQKARTSLAKMISKPLPLSVHEGDAESILTWIAALQTIASKAGDTAAQMAATRLREIWSELSVVTLLSLMELGGLGVVNDARDEIDRKLEAGKEVLSRKELPTLVEAIRHGSGAVRDLATRILSCYVAHCSNPERLTLMSRKDEVADAAFAAVDQLPYADIMALLQLAKERKLEDVVARLKPKAEGQRPTLPSTVDAWLDALKSGEESKQMVALDNLIENANKELAQRLNNEPESLIALLSSPRLLLRVKAVRLCEKIQLKAAVPKLIDLLLDEDDSIFRASCDALFKITRQSDRIPLPFAGRDERQRAAKELKEWWEKEGK